MTKKLLVTDSFFIGKDHIAELKAAGYEVIHLDTPKATEQELIEAIKDASVYILGGVEQVTKPVIDAAEKLEAIIFTGVDYDNFIPAADEARAKGIELYNAPGANSVAVAEFAVGIMLLMQRHLVELSRIGEVKGAMTGSIEGSTVGVLGAGNIAQKIIASVSVFRPKEVIFYNRSEVEVDARQVELDELLETADIIFVALPKRAGKIIGVEQIAQLKTNALLVSISPIELFDIDALLERVRNGEIRVAVDWENPVEDLDELPLERFYTVTTGSAYNTKPAIAAVSQSVLARAKELL